MKNCTSSTEDSGTCKFYSVVFSVSLVLIVFGFVYFYNLGGWLINDDEGTFVYQVWRVSEGDIPYEDMFNSPWPLFLYTGAGWMRLVGAEIVPMRVLSVLLTLGAAILVFLVAREIQPAETALLGMIVFLLHPDVFRLGRAFQPELFYVFFCVLGIYLFVLGYIRENLTLFIVSGLAFVVASFYKPLAVLVMGGGLLFLAVTWLRGEKPRRRMVLWGMVFSLSYGLLFGLGLLVSMQAFPHFSRCAFSYHLTQEQEVTLLQRASNGLTLLFLYLVKFAPFLLIALPAIWQGLSGNRLISMLSWQLPTALAFMLLSRELYTRLLLYLVPALSILFASALEPIRRLERRFLLILCVVGSVLVPWIVNDVQMLLLVEHDTRVISGYIQVMTPVDARVLSDYQDLNFYARRLSTYSGAELSQHFAKSGQITGAALIDEIEATNVQMVVVDVSPVTGRHMVSLLDYDSFRAYLQNNFTLVDVLVRADQRLEIYYRPRDLGE